MRIVFGWNVMPVVAACVLTLAACAATSGTSGVVGTSSSAADALHESGRTLTQAQLLAAGLQRSQWPKGIDALLDSGSEWEVSRPSTSPPQSPAACQPLVEVMYGTSGASAAADVSFQAGALFGVVNLDSYPRGRTSAFFASVRRAVAACPGLNISSYLGTFYNKIVPLHAAGLGDESISFGLMREVNGVNGVDRYDYVRVGATTVLIRQIGAIAAVPALVPTLLAPQVAKLQAAQS